MAESIQPPAPEDANRQKGSATCIAGKLDEVRSKKLKELMVKFFPKTTVGKMLCACVDFYHDAKFGKSPPAKA